MAGVTVTLSNGYAGASDANGVYTIIVPAGSYTATAADADRNCGSALPASATVMPQGNGTVTEQRMYQLIRQPKPIVDRKFEIAFLDPGVEAFAFTFG